MSLENLTEEAVIADFKLDADLTIYQIHAHDYGGNKADDDSQGSEEARAVLTVTAKDNGEFKLGSGIHKVSVEVEVRFNGAADNFTFSLLNKISEKVSDRLQPSSHIPTLMGQ